MRPLTRTECLAACAGPCTPPSPGALLQESLGGCPWRVAVASILLCRTRRAQAEPALLEVLRRWPTPGDLARAGADELERVVRPCGLHRNRARMLARFSVAYLGEGWERLQELPGVGAYVADAVGLVCFGCGDVTSGDAALLAHAGRLAWR